jgi:hypothetical protein
MEGIIRHLFFFIDGIVYKFIPTVYDFIVTLANQNIFKDDVIEKIAGRIYAILGIYVLFRLAFVLLLAIVDPNKLMDKEKGFGKILTRFIIGLFMIVAIPWVFDYAYKFQNVILKNNIITTVVFGEQPNTGTAGNTLSQATFSAFFTCNDPADTACTPCDADGNNCGELTSAINTAFGSGKDWSLLDSALTEKKDGKYRYEYSAGVSTVAGIAILLLLVTFSFDVAVRIVKLGFLEMITPLAVIGYIEPGGKGFTSWQKTSVSTYINLFVRLLAITFAGYIISLVNPLSPTIDITADNPATIPLIRVFIIIGTLIFAKEAPKIIADMFGVTDAGMGGFNPFKKVNGMVGAGIIGGAVGAGAKLVGGGVGGVAGGIYAKKAGGSAFAGTFQGMKTGFGNVKMKDAAKGNITGIGKTLGKGTFGAVGAAGNYVNKQVTGKDEKVGIINAAKEKMAAATQQMHADKKETYDSKYGESLRNSINSKFGVTDWDAKNPTTGTPYYSFGDKIKANKSMFSDNDFANSYEKFKISKKMLGDEKKALSKLQDELALKQSAYSAGFDATATPGSSAAANNAALESELTSAQEKIRTKNKDISDFEKAQEVYSKAFEDQKKLTHNKDDVNKFNSLEAYDQLVEVKKRIP